jgi:CHAT domain-containing protein
VRWRWPGRLNASGGQGDVPAQARAAFWAGVRDAVSDVTRVADLYVDWALAAGGPDERAEAFWMRSVATAREAMRRELPAGRLRILARSQDIATEAAYHLAKAERREQAVTAAEHSRGILLTRLAGGLSPAVRAGLLAAGRQDLLGSYTDALRRRADAYRSQYGPAAGAASRVGTPSRLEAAQADVARLTREIGKLTGAVEPLDLPRYGTIRDIARRAPVIYLGAAEDAGFALIVRGRGEPGFLVLPGLTAAAAARHRDHFTRPSPLPNRVRECVDWLAGPVLAPLVPEIAGEREIGLVPLGALSMLPVGAALTQASAAAPGGQVAVRYLPNARVTAGDPPWPADRGGMSALVVAGPPGDPPFPPLRRARAEAEALARRYRTTALADASRPAVLAALPAAELVHFVCHGQADLADPLAGGLLLQDGWLTVQQLLTRPPQRGQLVILAACQSQVAGLAAPDEVIGLPAALYQAGAAGVVAAQWQVDANAAFALLRRFHDYFLGGLPAAQALAAAQAWLRDATMAELASRYPDLFPSRPAKHQVAVGRATYQPYHEPVHWAAFGYTGR